MEERRGRGEGREWGGGVGVGDGQKVGRDGMGTGSAKGGMDHSWRGEYSRGANVSLMLRLGEPRCGVRLEC